MNLIRFPGIMVGCGISAASAGQPSGIAVVPVPAATAIERHMTGDYAQHAAAARELLRLVAADCRARGFVFGEYPEDPGAVGMANVRWTLGYETASAPDCAAALAEPYRLVPLPATNAAVTNTTLAKTREAGFALARWLPDSGYVQSGPTRIEYLDQSGRPDSPVRIVMPVRRRTWP